MYSLRERLFILDSKHQKERSRLQNKKLRVFYGWSKVNKIRKKEAISVIFENDRMNEEKTLKAVGKYQETVYIRPQTDGEKLDAEHSNRMFTEYSVFMDDKRIKGSLEKALQINMLRRLISAKAQVTKIQRKIDEYVAYNRVHNLFFEESTDADLLKAREKLSIKIAAVQAAEERMKIKIKQIKKEKI